MIAFVSWLLPVVALALVTLPLIPLFQGKVSAIEAKRRLVLHIGLFFTVIISMVLVQPLMAMAVQAEEVSPTVEGFAGSLAQGLGFISAALATGMSALGAGLAVAAAAPAAIGAFSENEKNFGKALIFVALGEGVAIYGLLISILIINKL